MLAKTRVVAGLLSLLLVGQVWASDDLGCAAPLEDSSRLAVAGGSITEIIFALNLQARLVAVDRTSNYPVEATRLPSIGYVRAVSAEGLLSLNPTAILGEHDIGPVEVVEQIRAAGVPIVVVPEQHSVQGIFAKVECIARLIAAPVSAVAKLKTSMQKNVHRLRRASSERQPRVAILLSLDGGVPTGGGATTSAHGVLTIAGAINVFAGFSGWKPISLEAMAQSNPDFILMPNRGIKAAGGVPAIIDHPSVRLTNAGKAGRVLGVDGMSLLGFGPRTLASAADLAEHFAKPEEVVTAQR